MLIRTTTNSSEIEKGAVGRSRPTKPRYYLKDLSDKKWEELKKLLGKKFNKFFDASGSYLLYIPREYIDTLPPGALGVYEVNDLSEVEEIQEKDLTDTEKEYLNKMDEEFCKINESRKK